MKNTLITTALFMLAISVASGQGLDLLAFNQSDKPESLASVPMDASKAPNTHYISEITSSGFEKSLHPLQQQAANLKLDSLEEYHEKEPSRYHVVFANKNALVHGWYDSKGELIKTIERYRDQTIPPNIRQKIALDYPQWTFGDNLLIVKFVRGRKLRHYLKLQLTLGKNRKTAKYVY